MRSSLFILGFFVLGIFLARFNLLPDALLEHDPTLPALWLLMGLIGLLLGAEGKLTEILRTVRPKIALLPIATTVGTFAGAIIASFFLVWNIADCLAVGSGFAYYSLSSVFITKYKGADLGTIALISNILRELFTLLFTPLVVKYFGPIAAISCGGASTMDTTLPIISKYAGAAWVLPAITHAIVLDFSVPFWVAIFCSL